MRSVTLRASFTLLLAAVMLMLHPVAASLKQRSLGRRLDTMKLISRRSPNQCFQTPLKVETEGYELRCGEHSHSDHPCFTHWAGDLHNVEVRPWYEPLDMATNLHIKDDVMTDFTMDKPQDAFIITYLDAGNAQLIYKDFDPNTSCYKIVLRHGEGKWRIWVSDDDPEDDRDIDTEHYTETWKSLCTKWAHIHVKNDG